MLFAGYDRAFSSNIGVVIDNDEIDKNISLSKGTVNYSILHCDCENELSEEDPYVVQPSAAEKSVFMFSVLPEFFNDSSDEKDGLFLKIDEEKFAMIKLDRLGKQVSFEPMIEDYNTKSNYKITKYIPERGSIFVFKIQKKS